MKIAFVFNPFSYKCHEENLRVVQKYFGLFPPLSLAWSAAIAEKAGHEAVIIDARTLDLSMSDTVRILKDFKPDVIGYMITTYMAQDTLRWIRYIKERVPVPVIVGGYNLRVYPRETLSHPEIDFGIVEQAYYTLPALLSELEKSSPDFSLVPGLVYRQKGRVEITDHPQKIVFNDFPMPARHLLPNHLYAEFPTERKNFTVMVTSLGCPFKCVFCEAGRTEYNPRSAEKVVAEFEECFNKFGIREIDIFDYEFTGDRRRIVEICQALIEKKIDMIWACRSRIDTVDAELLRFMYDAGCRRIYYGIESGSQEMLDRMNKGITLEQVRDIVAISKKIGIRVLGFFIIGGPQETKKTVKQTVRFAKELDLDYVQFSKCTAKPLTSLWREMVKKNGNDYWAEWVSGRAEDRDLPRPWTSLTNAEIDDLTRKAYVSYHCRPKFILRHLLNLKSSKEFFRKFRAFIDMVFFQERRTKKAHNFKAYNDN